VSPEITTLPRNATVAQIIDAIEGDGGVVVAGFANDLIGDLNSELEDTIAWWPAGSRYVDDIMQLAHGSQTKRFCGLARRSETFVKMLCDDRVAAVADHFLLPNCGSYRLNTSQLTEVGPGASAQVLHRDDWGWPPGGSGALTLSFQTITALTDFTVENGATVIALGSHEWEDRNRYPNPEETTQAELTAGSTLLYTGQLIHGAGANVTTGEGRRALAMSFVLGWLRTEENHYLAVPPEVACSLPERAQCLLGYRSYEHRSPIGRLGMVDHADPVHDLRRRGLLGDDAEEGTVWPVPELRHDSASVDGGHWIDYLPQRETPNESA
jgi:ectoine hydroxylase-related dioxygenase (phytanoyl-CoA dioxygenase family)